MRHAHPSRSPHPCIARRCGHGSETHIRTPELEARGETVIWCAACQRHEVRSPRWPWQPRSAAPRVVPSFPSAPF
ncbi:MAG TPA: hypothetical protein VMH49_03415 [Thermoplasmata archaeon]|nr:hypothetical protein [Thermoplasmata archaeon]